MTHSQVVKMAIAVMGDDETASSLILRLSRLGFEAIHARRGRAFASVLEAADVIVCSSNDEAAAGIEAVGRQPAPYVLTLPQLPDAAAMLAAMRNGVMDVLVAPVGDEELGARMRIALDRARPTDLRIAGQLQTLERDQRMGRYIQFRMLPRSPTIIDHYRVEHRVHPSMILSGDFVDYFRMSDRHFVFYIADVSGHGASSAFITVILKNYSLGLRREYHPSMLRRPDQILAQLNRELLDQDLGKHVALFIGVVDIEEDTVTYANAGHYPHALHVANGSARFLEISGKPVGVFDEVAYDVRVASVAPGDSLVMFSDGVLEVMHEEALAAKEGRLMQSAEGHAPDIDGLFDGLGVVLDSPGPDDMTCLVVTRDSGEAARTATSRRRPAAEPKPAPAPA